MKSTNRLKELIPYRKQITRPILAKIIIALNSMCKNAMFNSETIHFSCEFFPFKEKKYILKILSIEFGIVSTHAVKIYVHLNEDESIY